MATTGGIKRKATPTASSGTAPPTTTGGGGEKQKGKGTGGYDMPWVEKYRPRNLDDVVGNDDTLVRLRAIAEDGNMPNLILCGPPGTGKVCMYSCMLRCIRRISS
jgi:replication factor C subunit 2/4